MKPVIDTNTHDSDTYGVLSHMVFGPSIILWHAVSIATAKTLAAYDLCYVQD